MRITYRPRPHAFSRRLLALGLFMIFSLGVPAADRNAPETGIEVDAPAIAPTPAPTDKPKQCYNGCQSWGQMCNVDPRGVYKCQRRCEKFGEICE